MDKILQCHPTLHYSSTIFIDIVYHQNNVSTDLPSTIVEACKVITCLFKYGIILFIY